MGDVVFAEELEQVSEQSEEMDNFGQESRRLYESFREIGADCPGMGRLWNRNLQNNVRQRLRKTQKVIIINSYRTVRAAWRPAIHMANIEIETVR